MRYSRIGETINADQVIGKTLIADRNISIKRYPSASAPVVYTAKRGESVGTVYSWVKDGTTLYWVFEDANGKPYYAEHRPGYFSLKALQDQGAQTDQDIADAAAQAANPVTYAVTKLFRPVALAMGAFFIIKAFR